MPVGVGLQPVAGRCWRHHRGESRAEDARRPRSTERANTAWQLTRGASLRAQLNATVCARHGTARARCTSSGQGFAEPKARSRARASTARWGLEEAQATRAGRRTGTGYEVWDTRDERARDGEVLPPPGGPRAPRLVHRRLDAGDTAREQRGPRCARDADEATIDGRSRPAGARGRARVTRFLERQLRLQVNAAKRAGDRPWNRTCLGVTVTARRPHRRQVSAKALQACNAQGRASTSRPRGQTLGPIVPARRPLRRGWTAFVGCAEGRSPRRDRDQWSRRRLRSGPWKPWGRKS
jgi:hypothetical protein